MNTRQTIGPNICDNLKFLRTLARTKSETKRRRLLRLATSTELLAIVEICLNIVKARFHLNARQRSRILPYAEFIRKLGRTRTERGARKIVQKGSGLGFAALLTPIVIEAVRYLASSNSSNGSN